MAGLNLFQHAEDAVPFEAGKTIFQEGDPGDVMYVVAEGEAEILVHGRILDSVGPGGILG